MGKVKTGSLFTGVGGLDKGLLAAISGAELAWNVEIDPYNRRVLRRHHPDAESFDDVRTVGAACLVRVHVLSGGFPCQDLSAANAGGRGLDGSKSGLWREMFRVIRELRPLVVVIENSPRLVGRGLDQIVAQLDSIGFEVEGTRLAARDVGAPHLRVRLFIVARLRFGVCSAAVADPDGEQLRPQQGRGESERTGQAELDGLREGMGAAWGRGGSSEPGVAGGADGDAAWLDGARWPRRQGVAQHDWEPPRMVAARSIPHRTARAKAAGNAVVPQCAYIVGCRVRQHLEASW